MYLQLSIFSHGRLHELYKSARGLTGLPLNFIHTSCVPLNQLETKDGEDKKHRFEWNHISHLTRLDIRCGGNNSVFINWLLGPRSYLGLSHIHTLHVCLPDTAEDDSVNWLLRAIVSDVEADMASTGLELKAEHWQRKEAAVACRYTWALELRAQLAEEAVGQHQDGSHPDEERLHAVDEARAAR
jgi:hypothetical protein